MKQAKLPKEFNQASRRARFIARMNETDWMYMEPRALEIDEDDGSLWVNLWEQHYSEPTGEAVMRVIYAEHIDNIPTYTVDVSEVKNQARRWKFDSYSYDSGYRFPVVEVIGLDVEK